MSAATRWTLRIVLLLALLAATAAWALYYRLEHPARARAGTVTIFFAAHTPTSGIFRVLAREGVVEDARLAEIYYRLYRGATPLQAGPRHHSNAPTPAAAARTTAPRIHGFRTYVTQRLSRRSR